MRLVARLIPIECWPHWYLIVLHGYPALDLLTLRRMVQSPEPHYFRISHASTQVFFRCY